MKVLSKLASLDNRKDTKAKSSMDSSVDILYRDHGETVQLVSKAYQFEVKPNGMGKCG